MANKSIVGLDIGNSRIRGIEAIIGKDGLPKVLSVATVLVDPESMKDGEIVSEALFAESLKRLWSLGKFGTSEANVIVNNSKIISTLATLDDETDFEASLPYRLQEDPAFKVNPVENYISSHTIRKHVVQEYDSSSRDKYRSVAKRDVLLTYSSKDVIDSLISVCNKAGIRVKSIDIGALALIRGGLYPLTRDDDGSVRVHVDIGATATTIVIEAEHQPLYVRRIPRAGGQTITENIQNAIPHLSMEEAEKLKLNTLSMDASLLRKDYKNENSIFASSEKPEEAPYSDDEIVAFEIVNEEINAIVGSIKKTLLFTLTRSQLELSELSELYLTGGTVGFPNIKRHIVHEVRSRETHTSAPFDFLHENGLMDDGTYETFKQFQHEYTLAVGAITNEYKGNNE